MDQYVNKWFRAKSWQGQVLAALTDGVYLVQLCNAIGGIPTVKKIVLTADRQEWVFCDSLKSMQTEHLAMSGKIEPVKGV
jgi:hypothetical protein